MTLFDFLSFVILTNILSSNYHFPSIFWYPIEKAHRIGTRCFSLTYLQMNIRFSKPSLLTILVNFDCLLTLGTCILIIPLSLKHPCCFHVLSMVYVACFWRTSLKANKGNVYSCTDANTCPRVSVYINESAYEIFCVFQCPIYIKLSL